MCQSLGWEGKDGSGGKQHLGAALTAGILRSPAAPGSPPVTRAATPPTTAPTAIKRRFPHFQRLCGKGLGAGWAGSTYRGSGMRRFCQPKLLCPTWGAELPKDSSCFRSALSLIWGQDLQFSGVSHNEKSFNMDSVPLPSMNPFPNSPAMAFPSLVFMLRPVGLPLF